MTEGNIGRHLLTFAFPLFLGNLFQQFYNMVDAWVVGNYVSNEAFAAVGTVAPITNLLIYCFSGLATGAGVVISQHYGAHQYEKASRTAHTFFVLTLILSVLFTAFGVILTPTFLTLMGTAPSVMPESKAYLTIYFSGLSGLLLYNMGSGILRAVGNSRLPFLFLVVSALTNIVLDLVFVLVFHMGVTGVAYATIIAQALSATLTLITLFRIDSCVRLFPSQFRIHREQLNKILRLGFPAAIQMSITSFSSIFVQSYIYQFGADYMSGWAAYSKINQLVQLPINSMGLAISTFVGQNLGNRNPERAKRGIRVAYMIVLSITAVLSLLLFIFAPHLIAFFNDKPEVVEHGTFFLRLINCFYIFFGINTVCSSGIRGAGNARVPLIINLSCYVAFRQVYLFIVSNFISNTVTPLTFAMPVSWVLASVSALIYLHKVGLRPSRIVDSDTSDS